MKLVIAISILIFTSSLFGKVETSNNYYKNLGNNIDLFFSIYRHLNINYVDTINSKEFIKTGLKAMLNTLDPYTTILDKDDKKHYQDLSTGKYGGIGIYLGISGKNKRLTVISALDNTPASKAGLMPGDKIIKIDSVDTKDIKQNKISHYLRGSAGSKVVLTIKRLGVKKLLKFPLIRENISSISVPYSTILPNNIAYIRVSEFAINTVDSVKSIMQSFSKKNLKGLILDLRNNPGGLLYSAVDMVNLFIQKDKLVVKTKGKYGTDLQQYYTQRTPLYENLPLVVLINGGSASSSEITAGTLQDYDRAVIVGSNSFGKGLVQQIYNITDSMSLKVTIAKYFTPSGRLIQKQKNWGNNKNIKLSQSDTLDFKTINGRIVKSGVGIEPDIKIIPKKRTPIIFSLLQKKIFQNFCYKYFDNPNNKKLETKTYNTDKIMPDFKSFLAEELENDSLLLGLSELDSIGSYYTKYKKNDLEFKILLDKLKSKMKLSTSDIIKQNYNEIKKYLDIEFMVKYNGYKAKYPILIKNDKSIKKAISILNNQTKYSFLLEKQKLKIN